MPPNHARIRRALDMTILLTTAVAVATATAQTASLEPNAARTTDAYLADEQCASCHRAIYDSYQHVGMARSFSRPRSESIIEDFEKNNRFYHAPSQRHYEMTHRDGRFAMRRYQLDAAGDPYNELVQPVDWIIGSGNHSRGYLYHTEAGELFELPIAWYTQTQNWGMAPGYDNPDHEGVNRQITRDCMFCHNAYPTVPAGSDRYGQTQVFPHDLPEGTGCQRCHGPGAEHVRLADDVDVPVDQVVDAIVNPGRLPPAQRDDVCYQCHLQPTSKLTSFVRRFGRASYSYRPDQPIDDYLVHLDYDGGVPPEGPHERFEINHHPYRLRQSTCWKSSEGRLNCLTCHDPHRVVEPDDIVAHFRAACMSCHTIDDCDLEAMGNRPESFPDVAADNCIACHMPKRRTQDVVGVFMTDHLIQRHPPTSDDALAPLIETPPPRGAHVTPYLANRVPSDPVAAMYVAISAANDGNIHAIDALERLVTMHHPKEVEPLKELAAAQLKAGRASTAAATLIAVVQRAPEMATAWADLGTARAIMGQNEEAVVALQRACTLDPVLPEALYNLGVCYNRLGRRDDALDAYRRCVELRPNHAKAWLNLGNLLARAGELQEAIDAYSRAGAIEPRLVAAAVSLAAAHRHEKQWPEAIRALERGRRNDPTNLRLAFELARWRLLGPDIVRDPAAAIEPAQVAAAAAPKAGEVQLLLAWASLLTERPAEALAAGTRAAQTGGDSGSVAALLAMAYSASDQPDEARQYYAQARTFWRTRGPDDPLGQAIRERAEATFENTP